MGKLLSTGKPNLVTRNNRPQRSNTKNQPSALGSEQWPFPKKTFPSKEADPQHESLTTNFEFSPLNHTNTDYMEDKHQNAAACSWTQKSSNNRTTTKQKPPPKYCEASSTKQVIALLAKTTAASLTLSVSEINAGNQVIYTGNISLPSAPISGT